MEVDTAAGSWHGFTIYPKESWSLTASRTDTLCRFVPSSWPYHASGNLKRVLGLIKKVVGLSRHKSQDVFMWCVPAGLHLPDGHPAPVQHREQLHRPATGRQHTDQNSECSAIALYLYNKSHSHSSWTHISINIHRFPLHFSHTLNKKKPSRNSQWLY